MFLDQLQLLFCTKLTNKLMSLFIHHVRTSNFKSLTSFVKPISLQDRHHNNVNKNININTYMVIVIFHYCRASRVGGERGITRAVLTKIQVCERPLIYLLDTPGVLPPKIESVETGMKLALCGTILDHLVGEDIIAEYLLYSLNRLGNFSYAEKYDLPEPSDDIQYVLKRIAVKLQKTQKVKALTGVGNITVTIPNYTAAANDFIRAFRKGELGPVMLD
uniref:Mitochondrial ribosome-associated GTPase 1 n=1 Tax=Nothobranchius furzeri TaxID=105023 RepID=A0A8C6LP74_NOTFU